jgi:26S proteasome regulatory subunit N5
VEIERARLIKRLANINKEQGKIDEAADLMQEVAASLHGLESRINSSSITMMCSFFRCSFLTTFTIF